MRRGTLAGCIFLLSLIISCDRSVFPFDDPTLEQHTTYVLQEGSWLIRNHIWEMQKSIDFRTRASGNRSDDKEVLSSTNNLIYYAEKLLQTTQMSAEDELQSNYNDFCHHINKLDSLHWDCKSMYYGQLINQSESKMISKIRWNYEVLITTERAIQYYSRQMGTWAPRVYLPQYGCAVSSIKDDTYRHQILIYLKPYNSRVGYVNICPNLVFLSMQVKFKHLNFLNSYQNALHQQIGPFLLIKTDYIDQTEGFVLQGQTEWVIKSTGIIDTIVTRPLELKYLPIEK